MIPVTPALRPALDAALARAPERAMFPRANLRDHGLWDGAPDAHPNAARFWLDDPRLPGFALALTRRGILLPVPLGAPLPAPPDLGGHPVTGAVGEARAVRHVLAALGLAGRPARRDADEPHFALDLAALRVPPGPGALVPARDHAATALAWRHGYEEELHPPAEPVPDAPPQWLRDGRARILAEDGRPLAMTMLNAALPGIVQVGGVYVPPDLRGRGLARRAVGLQLAEARGAGSTRATLFAASEPAARAYRALGFERIGTFALVLFREEARSGERHDARQTEIRP